jgi:glycine/D-amino acid oxidase-like deaminating enzyme
MALGASVTGTAGFGGQAGLRCGRVVRAWPAKGCPVAEVRDAEITIVGGGAVGCAVAYVLARAGYPDIQVVERGGLAGATSGQAAGLVGQVRASRERCRLAMASVAAYSRIEQETGYTTDWRQTGSVRIAMTGERVAEFRALAGVARSAGLEVDFLTAARLAELCPVLDTTHVRAALWCPSDGYLQPNSLVMAYAGAARERGVTFATRTTVTGVRVSGGAVSGVRTDKGAAATCMVINAAGPWAAAVASLAGLDIPIVPVRHEYFVTGPVAGWHGGLPVLRIPDIRVYCRAEGHGILCGGWEADGLSLDPRGVAVGQPLAVQPDWDVLSGFAQDFARFVPAVTEAGVREVFRGFPAFSPDGRFVVGPVPGIRGFVMAAACNAHGVSGSAGLAEHVLESLQPDPSPYVRSLSPARFAPRTWEWESARSQAERIYEDYYSLPPHSGRRGG